MVVRAEEAGSRKRTSSEVRFLARICRLTKHQPKPLLRSRDACHFQVITAYTNLNTQEGAVNADSAILDNYLPEYIADPALVYASALIDIDRRKVRLSFVLEDSG